MSAFLDIQHDFSTPLAPFFNLSEEAACDVSAREALLDRAMGEGRRRKSSEKLRRGRLPAAGLSFVAKDATGNLVGTVRLWNIKLRTDGSDVLAEALLLRPLAVDTSMEGRGVGSSLMRHAIATARRLGHRAIVLAGDPEYYERFGFSAEKTARLSMPGPYEKRRLLALEIEATYLDNCMGVIQASGVYRANLGCKLAR